MVLEFGLLKSNIFPNSENQGLGVTSSGFAKIEDEEGNIITVLSEDSIKKWALIL